MNLWISTIFVCIIKHKQIILTVDWVLVLNLHNGLLLCALISSIHFLTPVWNLCVCVCSFVSQNSLCLSYYIVSLTLDKSLNMTELERKHTYTWKYTWCTNASWASLFSLEVIFQMTENVECNTYGFMRLNWLKTYRCVWKMANAWLFIQHTAYIIYFSKLTAPCPLLTHLHRLLFAPWFVWC